MTAQPASGPPSLDQPFAPAFYEQRIGSHRVTTIVNGRFRQNCYVVQHEATGRCITIDPGSGVDDIAALLERTSGVLDAILLTHGHFDHLGAAQALSSRFGVPCRAHRREQKLIRQAPLYALRLVRESIRVPSVIDLFEDVDGMDWNGAQVQVFETPGHTEGSVCYGIDGMVFTGDLLLNGHIGPTSYPGSDRDILMGSVEQLLSMLADECVVLPGHGKPWTIGAARAWWSELKEPPKAFKIFEHLG